MKINIEDFIIFDIIFFFKSLQKYEYQEQTAEIEVVGADGSIFVSTLKHTLQDEV